jgi:hypothetical protein
MNNEPTTAELIAGMEKAADGYGRMPGLEHVAKNYRAIAERLKQLQKDNNELKEELAAELDCLMRSESCCKVDKDDPHFGWWDTMAKSICMKTGARLVELGWWEQHPDSCGRRAFFRPIAQK